MKNYPAAIFFAPGAAGGMLYGGKTDVDLYASLDTRPDPDDSNDISPNSTPPNGQNTSFYRDPEIARLEQAGLSTLRARLSAGDRRVERRPPRRDPRADRFGSLEHRRLDDFAGAPVARTGGEFLLRRRWTR